MFKKLASRAASAALDKVLRTDEEEDDSSSNEEEEDDSSSNEEEEADDSEDEKKDKKKKKEELKITTSVRPPLHLLLMCVARGRPRRACAPANRHARGTSAWLVIYGGGFQHQRDARPQGAPLCFWTGQQCLRGCAVQVAHFARGMLFVVDPSIYSI